MATVHFADYSGFTNPFMELARMRKEMDRLFGDFMEQDAPLMSSGVFPALNVSENGDRIYVQAEIPGVKAEDIEVSVEGSTLTLRGERRSEDVGQVSYHRRERKAGRFHKAIVLSCDVNSDGVQAEYRDGVLKLILAKAEHAKPKKIEVKSN